LPPADSLIVLGQTSKKFLVVPEVNDLLAKVSKQEKGAFSSLTLLCSVPLLTLHRFRPLAEEKEEERRIKMAKATANAGPSGTAMKKESRR
jgi:hypothetical protein